MSARMALSGVSATAQGVRARSTWWTYSWCWDEVERFELRERGEVPRFRVHLRKGGRVHGFPGFFARSREQEARGRALFRELEKRLEAEHERRD